MNDKVEIYGPNGAKAETFHHIIVKDVWTAELMIDQPVTDIRIMTEPSDVEWPGPPFKYVAEYKLTHRCDDKGKPADNWIQIGTDPGEYRCTNCTEWL